MEDKRTGGRLIGTGRNTAMMVKNKVRSASQAYITILREHRRKEFLFFYHKLHLFASGGATSERSPIPGGGPR